MCQEPLSLQIAAAPEHVAGVRRRVVEHARTLLFSEDDLDDLGLAVGEACNNAVSYGGVGIPDAQVSVVCRLAASGCLQVEIKNRGNGFHPDVEALAALPAPQDFATNGRGFALMRALVDDVEVLADQGDTIVRLTKQRSTVSLNSRSLQ